MRKVKAKDILVSEQEFAGKKVSVVYVTEEDDQPIDLREGTEWEIKRIGSAQTQQEYVRLIESIESDTIVLADGKRMALSGLHSLLREYNKTAKKAQVGYIAVKKQALWLGSIKNIWSTDREIICSPVLIAEKATFLKAYGGSDLAGDVMSSVGYSLQKIGGVKFRCVERKESGGKEKTDVPDKWKMWANYTFCIPFRFLFSADFFRTLLQPAAKVQRDMVSRLLFVLFACFTFVFMPYISKDYGISGDEFVDHQHAGYVLDYFSKGDKAALNQPKTALHLYGNSVQVIAAAICRWFDVENYYELRHFAGGIVGALGILGAGLMGWRWGGGLCGLLSLLLMFFTPRYFGHSMNNLKDVPFAVGYILALFYTVRLFDYYPLFRLRHIVGLILGIALALGTRSGGLILYPMLFMYAGLYYILYYGIRDFYRFGKHADGLGRIVQILIIVIIGSYFLSILLWPFALQKPLTAVFYSLSKFTNYNVGLRTIFDGEQMMSNMLPWKYAPKYLCIGMPLVTVIGFLAYCFYMVIRKKEFSLISFFFLFAAVFPVFWVIYQNSNLYGGIRHLLFVMPPMVVVTARFWSEIIHWAGRYLKLLVLLVFLCLFFLPVIHMIRNHPNEYVYFNELKGGMKGAYGDYETDYYFNSLKQSSDWFKENVLPGLPKDQKTLIVSQASGPLSYYFRRDTNIRVIYSRYYEKYSKDWDYAIFGNVYISQHQLKHHLFPPEGTLYTPVVDGYPMSYVLKRVTKQELEGFRLEKEKKYEDALRAFEAYTTQYKTNEEVWSRMGKLYYITKQLPQAKLALENALTLHPSLNEALYMSTLTHIDLKEYPDAFKTVNRMLAENSSSADAWYLRATIHYKLKQYQNAIQDLNKILTFRPSFDRAHVLAGDIFRDNGDYKQAATMYQRATKYRNSINTQVQLADMYARMKDFANAEAILKKAVEVQASYYPIYKVKTRISLLQGNAKEAGEYLQKLDKIADDAEIFVLKAMSCLQMKDETAAQMMVERALMIDPGNVEALRLKKKM